MKIKTSELIGPALDWAVAKCEGVDDEVFRLYYEPDEPSDLDSHGYPEFHYSTVWAQGGPISERERIWRAPNIGCEGCGNAWEAISLSGHAYCGHTPLVAEMRCYVASKLGDEVDVPEELRGANEMKIKTSELIGPALDWAVAVCEGYTDYDPDTEKMLPPRKEYGWVCLCDYNFSNDWAQGGPIIHREMLGVFPSESASGKWCCRPREKDYPRFPITYADTPLIAAMRCYVSSKLGDEVDVPEELA